MNEQIRTGTAEGRGRQGVRGRAAEVAGKAKEQINSGYERQKGRLAHELTSVARALRDASDSLRQNDGSATGAMLLSRIAARLDTLGRSVDGKPLDEIVRDVERFARRSPAAFAGTAFLTGFAASRFLKSTARTREDR